MSKKSRSDRPASVSLGVPAGAGPDRSLVWLVLIIAFAAILRLYALGTVPHGFTNDEAQDGLSARQAIDTGMQVFYPENNGREGLYVNISSLLIRMLGNTIWAMRLPAAVFGILTVWIIYLLGAVLFSKSTGLWAALFTAASTWHLFNSRLTNRANLAPFFLSLALYLLFLAVRKVREGGTSLPWAISAGLIYGLGFHSYTSFRVTPALLLPLGVYSLLRAREEAWRRKLYVAASAFAAACLLAIAPLAHYFSTHPGAFSGRVSQVSVWSHPNPAGQVLTNIWAVAQMFFLSGDTDWKNNIAGRRELFFPVAICFAAGLYCALHAILKRREGQAHRRFGYALMLGWIVLGAIPSILTVDKIHALRASLMIPPVFLIAAIGAEKLHAWLAIKMPAPLRTVATACVILAICGEPLQTYFRDWANSAPVARDFEAWLVDEAVAIRDAPVQPAKYVAIPRPIFRLPEVPQVIDFLAATSTPSDLLRSNVHYVFPDPGQVWRSVDFCRLVHSQHPAEQTFCVSRAVPLRP